MKKKIVVADLLNNITHQVINKGRPKSRYITSSGIARIGIELATDIAPMYKKQTNVICFGLSELNLFKHSNFKKLKKIMHKVKRLDPPMLILNNAFKEPKDVEMVMKAFGRTSIPIVYVNKPSAEIYIELSPWISKQLASTSIYHGTLLSIFGVGVLITGDPGSGKSEAAMELIKTGHHLFVGDDAIEIYNYGQAIYGHSTEIAKHFLEVRGLGILNIARMFGRQTTLRECEISMIVDLVSTKDQTKKLNTFERLGATQPKVLIKGVAIPKYSLPVATGRPIFSLIESAVIDFKLKHGGYNSAYEYLNNYDKVITETQKAK